MADLARRERARLNALLKRLTRLSAAELAREDLRDRGLSFHAGVPYFEKTLGLFRGLAQSDLRRVPSNYLKIVADHAEQALAQFDAILQFTGEAVEQPGQVRNHMIAEVRDFYRVIYDDVALVVTRSSSQLKHGVRAPWYAGMPLAALMLIVIVVLVGYAYRYTNLGYLAREFLDTLRDLGRE